MARKKDLLEHCTNSNKTFRIARRTSTLHHLLASLVPFHFSRSATENRPKPMHNQRLPFAKLQYERCSLSRVTFCAQSATSTKTASHPLFKVLSHVRSRLVSCSAKRKSECVWTSQRHRGYEGAMNSLSKTSISQIAAVPGLFISESVYPSTFPSFLPYTVLYPSQSPKQSEIIS